jgi:hypothetical protein
MTKVDAILHAATCMPDMGTISVNFDISEQWLFQL